MYKFPISFSFTGHACKLLFLAQSAKRTRKLPPKLYNSTVFHYHHLSCIYPQKIMSLGRTLFHDLRPLFRVLEEPTRISPSFYYRATNSPRYAFRPWNSKPAFEVVEKEEGYVVEAELPGIKREQLDVKVGDKGRSLTIEGKVSRSDAVKGETGKISVLQFRLIISNMVYRVQIL